MWADPSRHGRRRRRQSRFFTCIQTAASRSDFLLSDLFFPPKCLHVHFICPATTNDILESELIFLPESNRNSRRPPRCLPTVRRCYPAPAQAAVIGLNTRSPWPLNQHTESPSGCSVIITATGNVHASVNVRERACVCWGWNLYFCLAGQAANSSRMMPGIIW